MNEIETIPMEESYRQQLKSRYLVPLKKNAIAIAVFTVCVSALIITFSLSWEGHSNYYLLLLLLPLIFVCFQLYQKMAQHNLHYFKDADYGMIIKERCTITRVFTTPAGINIYWLDSDSIKTFTPDPYRNFIQGDTVFIYYLKYAKEYLGYEII